MLGEQVDVLGPLELTLSHNERRRLRPRRRRRGAAGRWSPLVALGVVVYLFSRNPARPGMWVATGLLAGGAIGNLIDRIRAGAVTDFIELGAWPPFNLADVAITAGVVLLVLIYLREAEAGRGG